MERNIKLIVLGTGDVTVKFIKQCKTVKNLTILGNIPDRSLEYEERLIFDQQVRNLSIDILLFNDTVFSRADIIFSIEYRRIIPDYLVQKYNFVNCHGGLLPQWRGFSCNAWAIMNGAVEIGYSIHKMNEQLDDGILYFVKRIPIAKNQTYADVHGMLIDSILTEVPEVIKQIASGELSGVEQEGEYAYCNRFFPEMGFLKDFDKPSIDIVNLYRCMARPLGSGVYFRFKNRRFTIGKVSDARDFGLMDYIGIPGKVINVTSDSLWIKTKDSGVVLSDIQDEEGIEVMPKDCFRNGNLIQNGK